MARGVQADFQTIDTALPPAAKTAFKVYSDAEKLLVAVLLKDIVTKNIENAGVECESVEILFNPWNDSIGYYQFFITPSNVSLPYHFTPYEEVHTSAFRHLRCPKVEWEFFGTAGRNALRSAWVFAWFDVDDVFRFGNTVAFNIARSSGNPGEHSSWNPCTGHGMQDATSFGRCYLKQPIHWSANVEIEKTKAGIKISGRASRAKALRFYMLDPCGKPVTLKTSQRGMDWSVSAHKLPALRGRYRLYADVKNDKVEPRYLAFDKAPAFGAPFAATMTYDVPDDVVRSPLPYTPASLEAEIDLLKKHGINRIHWIDYLPENCPKMFGSPIFRDQAAKFEQTTKNCGDLLPLAARLAKKKGMEFIGIFKPFDMAFDSTRWSVSGLPQEPGHTYRNLEGRNVWMQKAIAQNQDAVISAHPEWAPAGEGSMPARIRFYSWESIARLKPGSIRLWISADNRRYTPYRGPMRVSARKIRRPSYVWSAAGNLPGPVSETVWLLELEGLRLKTQYAALELPEGVRLVCRAHAFAEAWNEQGRPVPLTLATGGKIDGGFSYWQEWQSWANTSPRMLEDMNWSAGFHGMVFARRQTQPTFLEPCCEKSHDIWLQKVRRIAATSADGAAIRTVCHHNNIMDYLSLAFAPAARARFRAEYGRDPTPLWDDATKLRVVRGHAYTEFVRKAANLVRNAGKTFAMLIEPGMEIPSACDQRMQFNFEWETWIREQLVDTILLKWWFSQNPFIHERVLPMARRKGIPVHIIDRNASLETTPRAIERAKALFEDAWSAGFAGYAWYEMANYKVRNVENEPEFLRHAGHAIRLSAASLRGAP